MDDHKVEWSDKLSVGDDLIDTQHRRLIELIGAIPDRATSRDPELLTEALEYAASHFTAEESYMNRVEYPGLVGHKEEHRKLSIILLEYKKQYESGETDLYAFKQFMFRWVRDHIMDVDREIGRFLASVESGS